VSASTTRRRPASPEAVQEALFEVAVRPELRYYRQILDALTRSGFGDDPAEAERVVSRLLGAVWAGQEEGARDGGSEEAFGSGLVDQARRRHSPAALALLRALAAVAPIREVRDEAAVAADLLVADGVAEAPSLDPVRPGRCWVHEDVFGDAALVICEYDRDPGDGHGDGHGAHALLVQVDHARFSAVTHVALVDEVEPIVRDLGNEARTTGGMVTLRLVDPAWARAVTIRGFARTDLVRGVPVGPNFTELRALALARRRVLPDRPGVLPPEPSPPTAEETRALVADFLAGPEGAALPDRSRAEAVATLIAQDRTSREPGDPTRVGPAVWEAFLRGRRDRRRLADVVRAWSGWAARRRHLPTPALEQLARALDDLLDEAARP
jgi:hypothetical protein